MAQGTLLDCLQVEQLDEYLFRGRSLDRPDGTVFGGQVMAQSLNAGARTVAADRAPHSLHAYFLRPGDTSRPLMFEVDPIRDGGSFSTRRVVASQEGEAVFSCSLSFMTACEGYAWQEGVVMGSQPEDPDPDPNFAVRMKAKYGAGFVEVASLFPDWDMPRRDHVDPYQPSPLPPHREQWLRYRPPVGAEPLAHQTLLAYISDLGLLATALLPHAITPFGGRLQFASLDHAMWFHAPFDINDWLLYVSDSHWSGGGRGLASGRLYTRAGVLVASTVQEGLMRPRPARRSG